MIQFGLNTFRAEINAWPCPPDEFVIVINSNDTFHDSNELINSRVSKLAEPFVSEYDIVSDYLHTIMAHVVRFTRFKTEPYKCHVHDIILSRMNHE